MTVAELIQLLGQYPPDMTIIREDDDGYHHGDPEPAVREVDGRDAVVI